jgi:RimJ/RimL family protein N-acetyltransferase
MFSLRTLNDSDASWIVEASQDSSIQQLTSTGGARSEEAALALIRGSSGERKFWAVVSGEEPVGVVSLHSVDLLNSAADVGYWIAPWARRQGAASAALWLIEEELKQIPGVQTIQLSIMDSNESSLALARKLGFEEKSSGTCSCGTQGEVSAVIFEKSLYESKR